MNIEFKRMDSTDTNFDKDFENYEDTFYHILSKSYSIYYGKEYHEDRIKTGKAILYIALVDGKIIGVSYVKRNKRRGGTAVYPEQFRRFGIAKKLVNISLIDFPKQYTILSTTFVHSYKMLSLMKESGFKMATTEKEIQEIVGDEFPLYSNFNYLNDYFVFDRKSERREIKRQFLTLLHTYY